MPRRASSRNAVAVRRATGRLDFAAPDPAALSPDQHPNGHGRAMNGNVFDRFVGDGPGLHLELLVQPAINYALVHNRVPLVRRLEIRNTSEAAMPGATVTVEIIGPKGPLVPPWQRTIPPRMAAGHTLAFDEFADVVPERSLLLSTNEAFPVDYKATVTLAEDTEPVLTLTAPSRVLAHNEWFHSPALYDSLAAFVQPNTASVDGIIREAAQILMRQTGSGALQGYQAGAERVALIGGAIYEALRRHGINYQALPASFEHTGQKVRTTSAVLSARLGNCLDLSVTYAACLEAAGLHPLIWLTRSHAFAGFLMTPQRLSAAAVTNNNRIIALIESGLAVPVELTTIGPGPQSADFAMAVQSAVTRVRSRTEDLEGVVDVQLAHRTGIRPLPSADSAASALAAPAIDEDTVAIRSIALPDAVARTALTQLEGDTEPADDPSDTSPPRVRKWKKALLDLSLRNPLLNLPARGRSLELHVPPGALALLDDLIHDGKKVEVVPQDQISGMQELTGAQSAQELDPEQLVKELRSDRRVYAAVTEAKYVPTMRTLQRDARTMVQETGSNYLYLTLGTLVHNKSSGEEAHAPLFLLPVRIEGGTGRKPYSIVADGTEIAEPNYCLIEWLRVKHSMQIPELNNPIRDERGIDIPATLAAINARLVDSRLDYRVDELASLRLLQFSTFQMWRDLTDNWQHFMRNPVVKHLVEATGETFRDPVQGPEDPTIDEADLLLPIPADGSQMEAIALAEQGRSFVLEGPPGTGKSQTITNLIARAVSTGRSVLFVAEKQAALDVVKRRLRQVGLDPFVLDLHGRKQSVRAIKEQLRTALDQREQPDDPTFTAAMAGFRSRLAPLSDYPHRVHDPNPAGASLWSGYAAMLAYGDGPVALIPAPFLASSGGAQVEAALRELPAAARSARLRPNHPWSISGRRHIDDLDVAAVTETAGALEQARLAVQSDAELAQLLVHVPSPEALADLLAVAHLAARGALPDVNLVNQANDPRWDASMDRLVGEMAHLRQQYQAELATYRPDLWQSAPLDQWLAEAREANGKFFGKGKARRAIASQLSAYLQAPITLDADHIEQILLRLVALRGQAATVHRDLTALGGLILPANWSPVAADALPELAAAQQATIASRNLRNSNPAAWTAISAGVSMSLVVKLERLTNQWAAWRGALHSGAPELMLWTGDAPWWETWHRDGATWLADLHNDGLFPIQRWAALLIQTDQVAAAGLAEFRNQLLRAEINADLAEPAYRRGVARSSVRERLAAGSLDFFDAAVHNNHIAQFQSSGAALRAELPEHLPSMVVRRRPFKADERRGRQVELASELRRSRGGRTFRELFSAYSDVILALTPCVLVSPASAAQFLAPDAAQFDLVVFDEASQIRVAEAVGAMGRGRASVIVGDSRQMPPSMIMQASHVVEETQTDEDIVVPEDLDSILSESVESGLPQRWLSWHYRSRDEALIAFSNRYYYDGRLSSLPSPGPSGAPAIAWNRLDGQFDRAASRTNKVEADAIVAEIAARLADPQTASESIGVVTFNIQQRDLILNLLEESNNPLIKAELAADSDEPIFVKNLENVQGDERDVVLFSLAFSPNPQTGQLPLNFGPLNLQGGERRLNVAITRARKQIVLFASFDPHHIDLSRTAAVGVHHLRAYCEQAATNTTYALEANSSGRRDLIREEIAAAIRERGFEVTTGLGLSEFTVDIAVKRPDEPRWQIAVMLDGPAWSQRLTVSDRDLTPILLTSQMGWPTMYRCWLPAWLHDRAEIIGQIEAAVPPSTVPVASPPARIKPSTAGS
jgi:hypothetical protein